MSRDWPSLEFESPGRRLEYQPPPAFETFLPDGDEICGPFQYFQQDPLQCQQAEMQDQAGSLEFLQNPMQYQQNSEEYQQNREQTQGDAMLFHQTPKQIHEGLQYNNLVMPPPPLPSQSFESLHPCLLAEQQLQSPPHYQSTTRYRWERMAQQYQPIPQMISPTHLQSPPQLHSPPQLESPPQRAEPVAGPSGDQRALRHAAPIAGTSRGDSPRELRNKAEKQRRDKLNQSISELAAMVPPIKAATRRIDKTGVLRLTAHYLRAHQYVFGDAIARNEDEVNPRLAKAVLKIIDGFLITVTYRGLVVVVSQNVHQYLGFSELDLLGHSIMNVIHPEDHQMMRQQLIPRGNILGPNGELLVGDDPEAVTRMNEALARDRRKFIVRFKKLTHRSEPPQYVDFYVEGSFRKSDKAAGSNSPCCQIVRRARARGDNPCSSGNDIVFIGLVRPNPETFITESKMEAFRMEYRTRHSVDGEIIQVEQKISLVTGYMTQEVTGLNALNFMHRDDVQWVVTALRDMYDQNRLVGESCYRLMTKNGQFIYMKTKGCLEVDISSNQVTTFICTNTMVDEVEGKHLIELMKQKFKILIHQEGMFNPDVEAVYENDNDHTVPVEDPVVLEQSILRLFDHVPENIDGPGGSPNNRILIIPPRRDRIARCIEKIYTIIKVISTRRVINEEEPIIVIDEESNSDPVLVIEKELKEENNTDHQTAEIQQQLDEIVPKLETFESVFLKRQFRLNCLAVESKITDQVLTSVQLNEASTSTGGFTSAIKRPVDHDSDDYVSSTNKRKTVELTAHGVANQDPEVDESELFDPYFIDSLLKIPGVNQAINMFESMKDENNTEDAELTPNETLEVEFKNILDHDDEDSDTDPDESDNIIPPSA